MKRFEAHGLGLPCLECLFCEETAMAIGCVNVEVDSTFDEFNNQLVNYAINGPPICFESSHTIKCRVILIPEKRK